MRNEGKTRELLHIKEEGKKVLLADRNKETHT